MKRVQEFIKELHAVREVVINVDSGLPPSTRAGMGRGRFGGAGSRPPRHALAEPRPIEQSRLRPVEESRSSRGPGPGAFAATPTAPLTARPTRPESTVSPPARGKQGNCGESPAPTVEIVVVEKWNARRQVKAERYSRLV